MKLYHKITTNGKGHGILKSEFVPYTQEYRITAVNQGKGSHTVLLPRLQSDVSVHEGD